MLHIFNLPLGKSGELQLSTISGFSSFTTQAQPLEYSYNLTRPYHVQRQYKLRNINTLILTNRNVSMYNHYVIVSCLVMY